MTSKEAAMHTLKAALKPAHDVTALRLQIEQLERDKAALVEVMSLTVRTYGDMLHHDTLASSKAMLDCINEARAILARLEQGKP